MNRIERYRLLHFAEIYNLSLQAAEHFPSQVDAVTGIYELLLNAVEHGNLGISQDHKTELLRQGNFAKELAYRSALPENAYKYVEIDILKERLFTRLTIRDQGNGFNWREQLQKLPDPRMPHGRGLLIARACGFEQLIFNEPGNAVICTASNKVVQMKTRIHFKALTNFALAQ